tara:strand:+ start:1466 stop:1660 length:195 start_codon:yes stop_codon:yes gene_type:complete
MANKYQHVIDSLKDDTITTVSEPRSNWRVKVYPPPRVWLCDKTLATKWVSNKINTLKYGKKEGK